ncbi:hypothetical protein HNP84_003754 [Thermocatellispora tengchongensis]|uniref:DUF4245 domain-containing protein n=1 Tax=Thermocatellispora tengchongensis TaxID=1073253 RepID=A0A840P2W4_9ACTN|nr:DUF4245 domain-containing protein [Thermocatellispora tengchongensis]MBB5134028.1 hypothetical protein [Thermocatellispora tengchongensis]
MERFTQGFLGYAVAMAVCLLGVGAFLFVTPTGDSEHIPSVDYSIDAINARNAAPYQVWVPEATPKDWVPTSSRLTGQGVVTWRLGFATAARSHAMLAQSNEQPAGEFVNRMANTSTAVGTQQIGGVTWERRYREDKNQRTLVRILPDVALVVTGQADWPELATLAASLRQQPASTATPAPSPSASASGS